MTTHLICQNSMTGAIHILYSSLFSDKKVPLTPCGYYVTGSEHVNNPNLNKRSKVCVKCHNSLKKSHNKNLIAHISYLKLKGALNGRVKI